MVDLSKARELVDEYEARRIEQRARELQEEMKEQERLTCRFVLELSGFGVSVDVNEVKYDFDARRVFVVIEGIRFYSLNDLKGRYYFQVESGEFFCDSEGNTAKYFAVNAVNSATENATAFFDGLNKALNWRDAVKHKNEWGFTAFDDEENRWYTPKPAKPAKPRFVVLYAENSSSLYVQLNEVGTEYTLKQLVYSHEGYSYTAVLELAQE